LTQRNRRNACVCLQRKAAQVTSAQPKVNRRSWPPAPGRALACLTLSEVPGSTGTARSELQARLTRAAPVAGVARKYKYDLYSLMDSELQAKPASQRRSRQKRDRILAALERLLKVRPFLDISVADLARAADVSPATIYQRFSNVDATASVLLELYFRKVEEWARRPGRALVGPDTPLRCALQAMAEDALDQVISLGHIMRPAYLYSRAHPDRVGERWRELQKIALDGFGAFVRARSSEITVQDQDEASEVLCHLFNFQLLGPLLHAEESAWKSQRMLIRFADQLADLAFRYLAFRP
jgi:AcrR family transcriptional regulator